MRADAVRSAGGPETFGNAGSKAVEYVSVLDDHLRNAASDYRLLDSPDARPGNLEVVAAVAELYVHISINSCDFSIKKITHMILVSLLVLNIYM